MIQKQKTRNLSVAEYFQVIQKEYLIAEFRRKIYYSPKDKAYYKRVMAGKARKINDIAKRNCLASILTNNELLDEMRDELFDSFGKPKFELNSEDIDNYYAPGNEFSFKSSIWILDQVREDGTLALYNPRCELFETANKEEVCRIL